MSSDNEERVVVPEKLWRLETWFPQLDQIRHVQLKKHRDQLYKQNNLLSLVPMKTIPNADLVHYADSILASELVVKEAKKKEIYDLASGGGFPGLILACLYPDWKIHLIDYDPKKCEFMKQCITEMGLKNCVMLNRKIEALEAASIDQVITRGFATVSKTILLIRKLMRPGAVAYHLKGSEWSSEVSDIPIQLFSHWDPGLVGEYSFPKGGGKGAVVKTALLS